MTAVGFVPGFEPRVYTRAELAAKLADQRAGAPTVPDAYLAWTPWTDTTEIPSFRRGVALTEQPTEELHLLDLRPPVPAPAPRPRRRFIARQDWAAAWTSATTVVGGIAAGLTVLAFLTLTRPIGEALLAASTGGHR